MACAQSLKDDVDGALASLELAFERGFTNVRHLRSDPDLEAVRADPRLQEILQERRD